jgi:hypothetical protein
MLAQQISDILIITREKRGVLSATEKSAIRQGYRRVRAASSSAVGDWNEILDDSTTANMFYITPRTFSPIIDNDFSLTGSPCIDPATSCADGVSEEDCSAFWTKCSGKEYDDDNCFKAWSNVLTEDGKVCLTKYKIDRARTSCSLSSSKSEKVTQNSFYP